MGGTSNTDLGIAANQDVLFSAWEDLLAELIFTVGSVRCLCQQEPGL